MPVEDSSHFVATPADDAEEWSKDHDAEEWWSFDHSAASSKDHLVRWLRLHAESFARPPPRVQNVDLALCNELPYCPSYVLNGDVRIGRRAIQFPQRGLEGGKRPSG
jgi:hypothetical protein